MKPITNIYILADSSFRMNYHANRMQSNLLKTQRMMKFIPEKVNLQIWQYSDNAKLFPLDSRMRTQGNPNLGEGLKMLKSLILLQRKTHRQPTRAIFIIHGGDFVLQGWQRALKELFDLKEFALGLRYVVTYGDPDRHAQKAYLSFTENSERVLHHFSESRLHSLVENLQRQ